jgi:hypothetical protein
MKDYNSPYTIILESNYKSDQESDHKIFSMNKSINQKQKNTNCLKAGHWEVKI